MDSSARSFARVEELLEHLASFIDDHTVLWALCLTSKTCYRIFRAPLWAEIIWDDRTNGFFQDDSRLATFLDTHAIDLAQTRSLRGIRRINAGIDDGRAGCSYLAGMQRLQRHMPNLRSYEWIGSWTRDAILTLARNCRSLECLSIGVDCDETPHDTRQRESWEVSQRALACLKSASISPTSTCETMESRATMSGYISRLILRQAPVLESVKFNWNKIKSIEDEAVAMEEFLFYFIGFLALEEVSMDRGLLSQADCASSWPRTLQKVEICVCPPGPSMKRACPRCIGHQHGEATSQLSDNDERLAALSTRVGEAFEWARQDCRVQVACAIWSDADSFWHVSVAITDKF